MSEKFLTKVIVEQRIYFNEKLYRLIGRIFGRQPKTVWRFIAWLKKNDWIDRRLRGELQDILRTEENYGNNRNG